MKNKLFFFIFVSFVSLLLLQMTSAVLMSDQGTDVKNKSSGQLLSLGNLSITIYDSAAGGNFIYQLNTSDAIVNGSWNLMISPTLEFGKSYWKDYAINGEDLDFDGNERIEFQSSLGLINNVSFINFSLISSCQPGYSIRLIYANGSVECEADDTGSAASNLTDYALKNQSENFAGNVNVSGNVTTTNYGFFGWLGSLASRIIKLFVQDIDASGNVNVSGNVTASYFIGNGSLLTGITSSSTYNATYHNYVIANISNNTNCWQGNCNISYFYPYSNPLGFITAAGSDSWSYNYTDYYNKTRIDENFTKYFLLTGGALTGNLNLGGFNITNIGNLSANYICNSTNCYTLAQFLIDTTGQGTDSWAGNYTLYYNKTRIDENFTLYYTKSQADNNFSLYVLPSSLYSNLSNYLLANGSRALTGNINFGGFNISGITNITASLFCNSSNCYNMASLLAISSSTDSWSTNYTNYYNKSQVDNNFTNYMLITSWNTNLTSINNNINNNLTSAKTYTNTNIAGNLTLTLLKNGSTIATGNFNFGGYNLSNIDNLTSNKLCNTTNCYTLNQLLTTTSSTDSWSLNYSFYYNNTQVNLIVSSNDTWRTNYTSYPTKENLYANLTGYLLINGSRALTGNINFGGFNISNIDNLTSNKICNTTNCYVLSDLLATSGSTYNATYQNYVTNNISNQTYNWITSNNLTINGINTTQMRNVNGILTVLRDWWDGLYCKLTGCTMTGDLNMNGNNITNVGNITSNYYCNSTNCYTLVNFLTDTTGGTDTWSLNYTFYYNKTLIDNNFSLYTSLTSLYANLTNYLFTNGSRTATGNLNMGGYNITNVGNITANYICNSSNCYTLVQFLTDTTGGTDSWAGNYTFYYNKTQIDNNFSLYMLITSWNTNLTSINNNINNNLTSANSYANSIVASNDTWRTNYSSYLTGANVNSAIGSNLSLALLANGSRIATGNINFGGFNISGITNITASLFCNSSNCYNMASLLATSSSTDSWSTNYTNYYNKSRVDNNLSLYYTKVQTDNNFTLYLPLTGGVLTGNLNLGGYNISGIGNITSNYVCNTTNCYTLAQFLATTAGTDSWAGNYTFYYNKTLIDNNFSLYYTKTESNTNLNNNITATNNNINLNNTDAKTYTNTNIAGNLTLTLLKNGSTIATGNFNFGGYNLSNIDNLTSNKICNSTNCYTLIDFLTDTTGGTDSWSLNYSFYYNNTLVNLIVSSNDTWRTNYTNYPTKSDLYANLTGYLLINGSRAITGNINFGGYNISNIDNLTSNKICNSTNCYVLSDLLNGASSGSTYNETYHNYITANISNQTYNWITSNNLTMNGINTTQLRNVNGILTVLSNWWDGLYCKLTGCTMTGDLNMNGNNITNVGNITSNYYCNSTNCYTLINFLTDTTGGTDSWAGNYTFYYNKTLIDNNFSSYTPITSLYANLTNYILANGSRTATGDLNLGGYNITNVGNITANYICNSSNCYTLVNFLTDTTGGADSWSGNYTFYYNKTQIDNNFSNYMSITSWNTNITNIFNQINLNYTSSLTTCNANINNNLTSINTNINGNLTSAKTYANSIVTSNDTWRTNYTSYPTKNDLYANLTLTLLANGSRTATGNFNFGGFNISNIDNLTIASAGDINLNGGGKIYSNITCVKIQGSTSLLEIC